VGLSKRQTREDTGEDEGGLEASRTITLGQTQSLSGTMTNGGGLEASRTITNGQVNGRGKEQVNRQVNEHTNGHTTGFREVPWADDVSAALANTNIR